MESRVPYLSVAAPARGKPARSALVFFQIFTKMPTQRDVAWEYHSDVQIFLGKAEENVAARGFASGWMGKLPLPTGTSGMGTAWDCHSLGRSQPAHTESLMWPLPASSLPAGKYPTHLLLGSICLSDPWMIVFNLAAGRVVQTASHLSELSCSSQQEAGICQETVVRVLVVELLAKISPFSHTRVAHY